MNRALMQEIENFERIEYKYDINLKWLYKIENEDMPNIHTMLCRTKNFITDLKFKNKGELQTILKDNKIKGRSKAKSYEDKIFLIIKNM